MNTKKAIEFIIIFILNLFLILICVASVGAGHGTKVIINIVFPYAMICLDYFEKINFIFYTLLLIQIPFYGILYFKKRNIFKFILALHFLAVIFVFYMK